MPDVERLWTAIRVGEEKAEGATEIWRRYDLGSRTTTHRKLNRLTAEGHIKRISRLMPNGGEVHLYYRAAE
jgi:predicted transcriptional regulator